MRDNFEEELDNAYYQAENLLTGFDVTAYVENEEDLVFWYQVFEKFAPNLKIDFRFNSRDNLVRGKQEILKSKDKLGNAFILCLDSDFDYLLQDGDICENPYIFQTYAYSIETFKCNPENLNRLCLEASLNTKKILDFVKFFEDLSEIYYTFLAYIIHFKKNNQTPNQIQRKNLEKILNIPESKTLDISQNGQKIIKVFEHKIEQILKKFDEKYPQIDLNQIKNDLETTFQAHSKNSWQFIIGHILYDNIEILLDRVVNELVNLKKEEIKKQKITSKEQVLEDKLNEYENQLKKRNISTLLAVNHQKCFIFNNCDLMQKIHSDIQNFAINHT